MWAGCPVYERSMWSGVLLVALAGVVLATPYIDENGYEEFCPLSVFEPTCAEGDVILMRHAHTGRKRGSSCSAPQDTVCHGDALHHMDYLCSGRRSCRVQVLDPILHKLSKCPAHLTVVLEVTYSCVTATSNALSAGCNPSTGIIDIPALSGYMVVTDSQSDCLWRLTVQEGQTINLWLLDFNLTSLESDDNWDPWSSRERISNICPIYASVHEGSVVNTLCGGIQRERLVYTSSSNEIEVSFDTTRYQGTPPQFMLKFEAQGCPSVPPPEFGYVLYDGERATVHCNHSTHIVHLVCKGTEWAGEVKQCAEETKKKITGTPDDFPKHGLVVAVIIGVIIGIVCGFSMLAAVLWCRRRKRRTVPPRQQREIEMTPTCSRSPARGQCTHTLQKLKGDYGLTHVWEVKGQGHGTQDRGIRGRSNSVAGSSTPDSAYLSYQGHMSGGASSTTASSGPGGSITGIMSNTLQHRGAREPLYEGPHMLGDGTLVHRSPLPCCRKFMEPIKVPVTIEQPQRAPTMPMTQDEFPKPEPPKVTTPIQPTTDSCGSGLSDDTDEDDDKSLKFIQKGGYALVPTSTTDPQVPAAPPRERKENHYT